MWQVLGTGDVAKPSGSFDFVFFFMISEGKDNSGLWFVVLDEVAVFNAPFAVEGPDDGFKDAGLAAAACAIKEVVLFSIKIQHRISVGKEIK